MSFWFQQLQVRALGSARIITYGGLLDAVHIIGRKGEAFGHFPTTDPIAQLRYLPSIDAFVAAFCDSSLLDLALTVFYL